MLAARRALKFQADYAGGWLWSLGGRSQPYPRCPGDNLLDQGQERVAALWVSRQHISLPRGVSGKSLAPAPSGAYMEGVSAACKSSGLWKEIWAGTQPWLGDLELGGWGAQLPEGGLGSAAGKLLPCSTNPP